MNGRLLQSSGRRIGALLVAVSALFLAGCPFDSDDDGISQQARFVDAAVSGLTYRCGNLGPNLVTGPSGELVCIRGSRVFFQVGDIPLGFVRLARGVTIITPASLVADAEDETDQRVLNIARFLISLDEDADPENGIQIPASANITTGMMLDWTLEDGPFEDAANVVLAALTTDAPGGPYTMVSAADAEDHLIIGLLFANAGYYEGTVTHSADQEETRTIGVLVSREGYIYGSNETAAGLYAASGQDEGSGSLSSAGEMSFKVDGSTGATVYVDAEFGSGTGSDVSAEYPDFSLTRQLEFAPLLDEELLADFETLLPMGVDLDPGEGFVGVLFGECGVSGVPYSDYDGGPDSPSSENDVIYGSILVLEVVSTDDDVVRLAGISMAGYVLDIRVDLSTEVVAVTTNWRHLHDNVSGSSTVFDTELDCSGGP